MDVDELACRIAEAIIGIRRPEGVTPQQALAHLKLPDQKELARAARAAIAYANECAGASRAAS